MGKSSGNGYTPNPLAPMLPQAFPEIQEATRIVSGGPILFSYGEKSLYVD